MTLYTDGTYTKEAPRAIVVSLKGISVYREYHGHDVRQPQHWYFAVYPENNLARGPRFLFDIRELACAAGQKLGDERLFPLLLRQAIDQGELPSLEWRTHVDWPLKGRKPHGTGKGVAAPCAPAPVEKPAAVHPPNVGRRSVRRAR